MLRTADLEYDLPQRLIATRPCEPRDAARLLVVSRSDPSWMEHAHVRNLPGFLRSGDALVLNRTVVLPARLRGVRRGTGGRIDGLFLETALDDRSRWRVMLRSGGRLAPADEVELTTPEGDPTGLSLRLLEGEHGQWWAALAGEDADAPTDRLLDRVGATPLPPYILGARRTSDDDPGDALDRSWYQTVYARPESADGRGASVAAPTAGLHFTPALLERVERRGVRTPEVVLHVGAGTFRPVDAEHVEDHHMHAERYYVAAETLRTVDAAREAGGRCVCVGTTAARALESAPPGPADADLAGETRLLVTPGYQWRRLDGLLTNFHLPRSTLMAMVAALFPEGPSRLLEIYGRAVEREYRFYSYGDAMLVLP